MKKRETPLYYRGFSWIYHCKKNEKPFKNYDNHWELLGLPVCFSHQKQFYFIVIRTVDGKQWSTRHELIKSSLDISPRTFGGCQLPSFRWIETEIKAWDVHLYLLNGGWTSRFFLRLNQSPVARRKMGQMSEERQRHRQAEDSEGGASIAAWRGHGAARFVVWNHAIVWRMICLVPSFFEKNVMIGGFSRFQMIVSISPQTIPNQGARVSAEQREHGAGAPAQWRFHHDLFGMVLHCIAMSFSRCFNTA